MSKLFIPGPTNVDPQVAAAQSRPMISHRGSDFEALFARLEEGARKVFRTEGRVFIVTSSGTGLQEAAVRNCVRERALLCVNGAFSERWYQVAQANGKATDRVQVAWGQAIVPGSLEAALQRTRYDALLVVHNETSTGVESPVQQIAQRVRELSPDTLVLVDAVSSLGGARLEPDAWGIDVLFTSSQKCLGLPPGLALASVSERALRFARQVPQRGYYFDFVELERYLRDNETPSTPAISLLYALEIQLGRILAEGLEARWARHRRMGDAVRAWASDKFALFAQAGYASQTVTCVRNTRGISVKDLNQFLRTKEMQIAGGYGQIGGETFRIAHMGETTLEDVRGLLETIDEFLSHPS
ncbi:MAG: alanine--glyoxylate aminotransferase family protein [Anaerolineales bacterium]|jgi:aspartate aminotransferase-like enzyme